MNLQTYTTGIQHIGIPTNDIEKTIEFYKKLGFETALQTINEGKGRVQSVFVVIETTGVNHDVDLRLFLYE